MSTAPANPKPKRRWFQFSLRSLGVIVALCCVGLAIERNAVLRRQRSIAEIKRIGGVITFDESRSFRPAWMQFLSGEVAPTEVVGVDLKERRLTEDTLMHLAGFSHLEKLNLSQTNVNDGGLARLRGLTNLRRLWLRETKVTGSGLSHLQGMGKLELLYVSGELLKTIELREMPKLKSLYLGDGFERGTTCLCHDCPALDRLDVRGEFTSFDLRNVPMLLEFQYESAYDDESNILDNDVSVTLHGAAGLHSLNIGRVAALSLDFQDAPNLGWIRLVPRSFAKVRFSGVPLLADGDKDISNLGEPRNADGYLFFFRAREGTY